MPMSTRRRFAVALAIVLPLVLSACSSGAPPSRSAIPPSAVAAAAEAGARFPVSVGSALGPVTVGARPRAIVSLSPTATEDLFGIGAGPQVIAVDDQSNFPVTAPKTDLSGFKPNVEAIAAKNPDLVVISDDGSGLSAALGKLGIPVVVDPPAKTLEEAYAQIAQLGTATGHPTEAATLVSSMRARIDRAVRSESSRTARRRIYHELDQTLYSATSTTFIGQLYKLLGADDIADAADRDGSGFPQLSAEYVVRADPQVIFLADTKCCQQSRSTVAARPGWSGISAVRTGAVVPLDDDIASRWGPRVVDLVAALAAGLAAAPAA